MKTYRHLLAIVAVAFAFTINSCGSDSPDVPDEVFSLSETGVFIVNNGNFGYANSSLSFYDTSTMTVENNVFRRANDVKLGDVAQSVSLSPDGKIAWICVNNSNVVFAVDSRTCKELGRITSLASPRYALQLSSDKVYVSNLYSNAIAVVNPHTYSVVGRIEIPGMEIATGSTEQLISIGGFVYCNCWSYQKTVVKIDPSTDKVVDMIEVGIQPQSMAYDSDNNYLWVLTNGGGWAENPIGYEEPAIHAIDLATFSVVRTHKLKLGDSVNDICYYGGYVYWTENGVHRMSATSSSPVDEVIVDSGNDHYYGLSINPHNGDIYVANALDYQQDGYIEVYSREGVKRNTFQVGILPCSFCWKN